MSVFITLNPGSSSLKYAIFEQSKSNNQTNTPQLLQRAKGKIARVDESNVIHSFESKAADLLTNERISEIDLSQWISIMNKDVNSVLNSTSRSIPSIIPSIIPNPAANQTTGVAPLMIIRVVHDAGLFNGPQRVTRDVISKLESIVDRAPLHLPVALRVIKELQATENSQIYDVWLVFDTHFHRSLPREAQSTGLPLSLTSDNSNIRRFGFHGFSHQYIRDIISQKDSNEHAILSCHLGSGVSVCAIENGRSIQTSMGFGPGTGVMMGSRAGDVDWEALLYSIEQRRISTTQARTILYQQSGIRGMTHGRTDLMPEVLKDAEDPNNAKVIDQFVYDVVMRVGSYIPLFQSKPTHLVFTGGIGAGSSLIRSKIVEYFRHYYWMLDQNKNEHSGEVQDYTEIQTPDSAVTISAIQTNEELVMVHEVLKTLEESV